MRDANRTFPLLVVSLAVVALVSACRALGFGDGILLGATPASGLALGAAVVLRSGGVLAAATGFAVAGLAWGLPAGAVAVDAVAHGAAAAAGAFAMRSLARRREVRSKTSDWLIFLVGVCVFAGTVSAGLLAGGLVGLLGAASDPLEVPLLALVFEPLGVLTFGAILASLGELSRIRADPRPAVGVFALAAFLLGVLWLLLSLPLEQISPSGVTLLLSVPFCLWVAMQRRSLDGAVLSFLASHLALFMLLRSVGSIDRVDYVTAIIYLNLLVATCQMVHAVNLDRLAALAEVEARKGELEDRVAQRTARLNAMTERALAADAAKSHLLATVSHEVRTPLGGILGMASVVLASDIDAETRRNVGIIRTSGHHMLDVINRLLDYARLGQGSRGVDDVAAFDLGEVVDEVLAEARFLPYAEGIELRAEVEPGLPRRRSGSRRGLRQILTNLVGNAARFTERGSVTVRVAGGAGSLVLIEVEDTGVGIAPGDLERIFLPFEQADSTGGHGGTGLGLAISREVVKRMGGTIGVESAVGAGTRFRVEIDLPVATDGRATSVSAQSA